MAAPGLPSLQGVHLPHLRGLPPDFAALADAELVLRDGSRLPVHRGVLAQHSGGCAGPAQYSPAPVGRLPRPPRGTKCEALPAPAPTRRFRAIFAAEADSASPAVPAFHLDHPGSTADFASFLRAIYALGGPNREAALRQEVVRTTHAAGEPPNGR